jgi:hypothetical protein
MAYANRAPKWVTILVALVLTVVGILGTFVGTFSETIGVWSYVSATVVLLVGILFRGL